MLKWQYLLLSVSATAIAAGTLFKLTASERKVNLNQAVSVSASESISTADSLQPDVEEKSSKNLLEQLDLTEPQKQEIARIRQQYQQQIGEHQDKLRLLQQQLAQMMAGEEPAATVRLKNQELMALRREIGELRFESMLATREVLTLPQRQQFMKIVRARREQL